MINTVHRGKTIAVITFMILSLGVILFIPAKIVVAVEGAPEDNSAFYVNLTSEGPGVPMARLPKELGVNYASQYYTGAMGVLVSNGVVVEETDPAKMENTHNKKCGSVPGWTCSGNFNVNGTYKGGHLTIVSTSDETYAYDGAPIEQGAIYEKGVVIKTFVPTPIAPGNVTFKSETRYECDVENVTSFACSMTRAYVKEPTAECIEQKPPSYQGAYGWDICATARYATKPQETKTGTANASVVALNGSAIISTVAGNADVVRADGETIPARVGIVIKKGDAISTGYESTTMLDFGYATLTVSPSTHLKIDEYTNQDNIAKTQLYMRVGTIQAKVKQVPAIRSDFSVSTPSANAGIRGSEMQVSYDETTKETTVIALEDKAYVKGTADAGELEVPEKKQVTVDAGGKTGSLAQATATSGNTSASFFDGWKYGAVVVVLAVIAFVVVWRLKKNKTKRV